VPRPADAGGGWGGGGISPGAAVGLGLGAFALGSVLSRPYYNPYYYPYGYYGYPPRRSLLSTGGVLSVLSAAGASLPAGSQLTSTELYASGGPVRRQHRQTIEPTGAELLASSAGQSTSASVLSTAALLKDLRAPAA
jgi:hypothetical protein